MDDGALWPKLILIIILTMVNAFFCFCRDGDGFCKQ